MEASRNEGTEGDVVMPVQEFKVTRPDAPWMKDEIDEFEDLTE
jgi:hypothetical protein